VADMKRELTDVLEDPVLYAYVKDQHDKSVQSIYEAMKKTKIRRKRKHDDTVEPPESTKTRTAELQGKLDTISLKCWPLDLGAAMFVRGSRYTDYNSVHKLKFTGKGAKRRPDDLIIIASVYSHVAYTWNLVERCSQHALLSSQTLGDLYDIIPCLSNELPQEVYEGQVFKKFDPGNRADPSGMVAVIEGTAYGDGFADPDYAVPTDTLHSKLVQTVSTGVRKGSTDVDETYFNQLALRLNEPYWLLHEGNCEHYIVIDEIRLAHADDPLDGFPLTLHITPPGLDNCRACQKVPAVHSVVGDVRLGESPCVLCSPCWRAMGPGDQEVRVHSLPKYEHGWILGKTAEDELRT
ncbi:snRNA-activating protein of 50kDa MW C terminal-domain-containing protein, partial [Vararia minispora EC-137]